MEFNTSLAYILRSLLACRFVEIICKQIRSVDDDVEEFIREFALCVKFISSEHYNSQRLVAMLLNGLPPKMVAFMKSTCACFPEATNNFGQWPPGIDDAIDMARKAAGTVHGIPALIGAAHRSRADMMLKSFQIMNHHKSDSEAIARFNSFYDAVSTWSDEELVKVFGAAEQEPKAGKSSSEIRESHQGEKSASETVPEELPSTPLRARSPSSAEIDLMRENLEGIALGSLTSVATEAQGSKPTLPGRITRRTSEEARVRCSRRQ